jgi:hypothetical protein
MSRFQAQTNAIVDQNLEELSSLLGLRANQKADLLRELTAIASWVVDHASKGRNIEAREGDTLYPLDHPVVERLRRRSRKSRSALEPFVLSDEEAARLAEILEHEPTPTPELRAALQSLSSDDRQPPHLSWS